MEEQLVIAICGGLCLVSVLAMVALLLAKPTAAAESRLAGLHGARTSTPTRLAEGWKHNGTGSSETAGGIGARLVQAGLYRRNSLAFYLTVKILLASVLVVLGLAASLMGWLTTLQGCLAGVVLGLLGTVLPSLWLDARKRNRQMQLRRALPDALDVIVVCVEAGLSVSAAIARVAQELQTAHPMLATEMLIVEREIQLGCTTGQALGRFAERFDLEELRSLASVIMQAEKFGASIARALRVHAETLRVKRFQRAEERAQTASAKLLFPTILCIFPALYVVLLGPAVFEINKFLRELTLR